MATQKNRRLKRPYERTRVRSSSIDPETKKVHKTKAVQSEAKHADINHIVAKAHQTGQLPVLMQRQVIPEMPDVESYQEALNKVVFAQQAFEQLPSNIRAEFENRPDKMLAAFDKAEKDPQLKGKLQEIGLLPSSPAEQSGKAAKVPEGNAAEPKGEAVTEGAKATE